MLHIMLKQTVKESNSFPIRVIFINNDDNVLLSKGSSQICATKIFFQVESWNLHDQAINKVQLLL